MQDWFAEAQHKPENNMTAPAACAQVDGIACVSVYDIPLLSTSLYTINI